MGRLLMAGGGLAGVVIASPLLMLLALVGTGAPPPCTPGDRTGCGPLVAFAPGATRTPAQAVQTALAMVGTRSGWHQMCDRLVCRTYGYANSGYPTAAAHWGAMRNGGWAHPDDRCPPAGSFVFWAPAPGTDDPGHVALVVGADPACDSARIALVSNDVGDATAGTRGGIYQVSLARIETGFMNPARYLGWSVPLCAGGPLPEPERADPDPADPDLTAPDPVTGELAGG